MYYMLYGNFLWGNLMSFSIKLINTDILPFLVPTLLLVGNGTLMSAWDLLPSSIFSEHSGHSCLVISSIFSCTISLLSR